MDRLEAYCQYQERRLAFNDAGLHGSPEYLANEEAGRALIDSLSSEEYRAAYALWCKRRPPLEIVVMIPG